MNKAVRFVVILGIANLFADLTYEGARSINGQYLGLLGASAATVGFAAGFGELVGYGLRIFTGRWADRTGKYWWFAISGYVINMGAVPALALAGSWPLAAGLIIVERTGKAIRKPSTGAMLSFAGEEIGHGWAFGLNEALDQFGAALGPLIIALVLVEHGSYKTGFGILGVSAALTVITVLVARWSFSNPTHLVAGYSIETSGLTRTYWRYLAASCFVAAGFADFSLIAFHLQHSHSVSKDLIPVLYSGAMITGVFGALVFSRLTDRFGIVVLVTAVILSAGFAPLVFYGTGSLPYIGMALWGIGLSAQESVMKALLAGIVNVAKRASGFGLFDAIFGVAWFLGSWLMGALLDRSLVWLVGFSVAAQLISVPIYLTAGRVAVIKN